jgi:hypothetical protein
VDLLDELEHLVVCDDKPMGTLLLDAGVPVNRRLEELCIGEPDRICAFDGEYVVENMLA